MTSHQLARILLTMEDKPVYYFAPVGYNIYDPEFEEVTEIKIVNHETLKTEVIELS